MASTGILAPGAAFSRAAATALDWLLPPQCLSCRALVDRQGQVCAECWQALSFIDDPMCAACALPFDYEVGAEALCGGCTGERPVYSRARAVMRYDDASRRLILAFKHADRTAAAPSFGVWMARAGAEMLDAADALVPVPLHRFRLFARRYNQAALWRTPSPATMGLRWPPISWCGPGRRRRKPDSNPPPARPTCVAPSPSAARARPRLRTADSLLWTT